MDTRALVAYLAEMGTKIVGLSLSSTLEVGVLLRFIIWRTE